MALPRRCTLVDPAVRSRQLSTRQARALRKSGGSCYGHGARCFDDDFVRDEDCAKLLDGDGAPSAPGMARGWGSEEIGTQRSKMCMSAEKRHATVEVLVGATSDGLP